MKTTRVFFFLFSGLVGGMLLSGCNKEKKKLFELLSPSESGISFNNVIAESDSFNILTEEYIYNGGGVAIADFNNDGLQDIFFTGNAVPNALYINKGNMKFEDVTEPANVNRKGSWYSGAVVVDINNDGWEDLYVTTTMLSDSVLRTNQLFVNKGADKNGVPRFEEQASAYGIDDKGYSTSAAFFDYDLDGDLDLYVLTNQHLRKSPSDYRVKMNDGSSPNNDRLYRNDGGRFVNVTKDAGIIFEGYGLGLAISDLNNDGWPDIYVSNDFLSNDLLYINNKNGTFTNRIAEYVGHQSHSSMGNDAADFNNDGLVDIVTLDMLPETNTRKKSTINNKSYSNYINNEKYGYEYQFVRNMLHVNNGLAEGIHFGEVGQLSGVHQTEWSWAPLFADFDNDGMKDLFITNGFPKDITDKDFSNYREDVERFVKISNLIDSIPEVKVPNYAFRNRGGYSFEDVSSVWGLSHNSFSNGAAFADLDNDGDLDYVVNNINQEAFVYRNHLRELNSADSVNYLRIRFEGEPMNRHAIGAKVVLFYNGKAQYFEQYIARGYLSSVEPVLHIGLGASSAIDSIVVQWPRGEVQRLTNVTTNQVLTVKFQPDGHMRITPLVNEKYLTKATTLKGLDFKHEEEDRIDFNIQRTLPHKFSQSGPALAVGDVNGDGLDDLVVGGAYGKMTKLFVQQSDGGFSSRDVQGNITKAEEEQGILLFDADSDGDLDLYLVSGGIEHEPGSEFYQDQLWINDGQGKFSLTKDALPKEQSSGSCARAADFDGDGDLDLFIGGRVVPGSYPLSPESYILKNNGGKFVNATTEVCPTLSEGGMITDAIFSDFDNDGKVDLITVGEFASVTFYRNDGKRLTRIDDSGIDDFKGWWNSITAGDFDQDGDIDYVAGNHGNNNSYQVRQNHPLHAVAKDFDSNGSIDLILGCYVKESPESPDMKLFPVHFWDEMNSQSPRFRKQFKRYSQFGRTTFEQLFKPEELEGALRLTANCFESSYIENLGNGKFKMRALPQAVQVAPINGAITADVNADGYLDVMLVGNDYGNEVFAGRYDAFTGMVLLGDGRGNFTVSESRSTGFYVPKDAKALAKISLAKSEAFIATQNRDSLLAFVRTADKNAFSIQPMPMDAHALISYTDGSKEKIEFVYGSGYLSQSGRRVVRYREPVSVEFITYDGKKRTQMGQIVSSK